MESRRSFLQTVLSASALLTSTTEAFPAGFRSHTGCFIKPADLSQIQFGNAPPEERSLAINPESVPIIGESGHGENFDRALGRVLNMISQKFSVTPGFGFYDDSAGRNALAAPVTRLEGTRDLVIFGLNMLNHLLSWPRDGQIAVVAVCAHEFAHIYQYSSIYYNLLQRELPPYRTELHADFLTGYFMWRFREARKTASLQGVGEVWSSLGSSDFNRPASHGTSQQRVAAIENGYFFARDQRGSDINAAAAYGYQYVERAE